MGACLGREACGTRAQLDHDMTCTLRTHPLSRQPQRSPRGVQCKASSSAGFLSAIHTFPVKGLSAVSMEQAVILPTARPPQRPGSYEGWVSLTCAASSKAQLESLSAPTLTIPVTTTDDTRPVAIPPTRRSIYLLVGACRTTGLGHFYWASSRTCGTHSSLNSCSTRSTTAPSCASISSSQTRL
jgi:hypothetical protein